MTIGNGNIRAGVAVAPTTNDQRMGVLSNRCGQASQLGKVAGWGKVGVKKNLYRADLLASETKEKNSNVKNDHRQTVLEFSLFALAPTIG